MSAVQTSRLALAPYAPEQRAALQAAAAADGHVVIYPTHVVERGGEIVGYGSLGRVRMMFAWLDSRKLSGPESFRAWRLAEEELARQAAATGSFPVCLPCTAESPLRPFVERKGYRGIFDARIHLKQF